MVGVLLVADMAMVAFAGFVVVAEDAGTVADEGEAVFVGMMAAADLPRDVPDDDFDEGAPRSVRSLRSRVAFTLTFIPTNQPGVNAGVGRIARLF